MTLSAFGDTLGQESRNQNTQMKKIKDWNKIKEGQAVIQIYSDGSGLLSPQVFCGLKDEFPLLRDYFDEFEKPSLANVRDTEFYRPDRWYWEFFRWHLLDLKSAYGRYWRIERSLENKYTKVCKQRKLK